MYVTTLKKNKSETIKLNLIDGQEIKIFINSHESNNKNLTKISIDCAKEIKIEKIKSDDWIYWDKATERATNWFSF